MVMQRFVSCSKAFGVWARSKHCMCSAVGGPTPRWCALQSHRLLTGGATRLSETNLLRLEDGQQRGSLTMV
jgi:hypothetical protein